MRKLINPLSDKKEKESKDNKNSKPLGIITDVENTIVHAASYWGYLINQGVDFFDDEIWDRWAGKDLSGDTAVESLRNCLATLTERAQTALRMRFAEQASRVEIGEALSITDHGARNLMQRAKQQLRRCVEEKIWQNNDE